MNPYKCEFLSADVSTESLDLIFDPDKAAKREQDILASQEDARDEMIKNKLIHVIFDLLSQENLHQY